MFLVLFDSSAQVKGPCKSFKELYRWNEIGMDKRHVSKTASLGVRG